MKERVVQGTSMLLVQLPAKGNIGICVHNPREQLCCLYNSWFRGRPGPIWSRKFCLRNDRCSCHLSLDACSHDAEGFVFCCPMLACTVRDLNWEAACPCARDAT